MFVVLLLVALVGSSTALPAPHDAASRRPGPLVAAAWIDTSPLVGALAAQVGCELRGVSAPEQRARRAAWLPDVTVRGDWDRGYDVQRDAVYDADFTPTGDLDGADARDLSRWGDGRSWSVGLQLSWDFSDVRYHPDEDVWSRERSRQSDAALRRTEEALDVWRVRAAARRRVATAEDDDTRQMASAEVVASDAWLDALTHGWWTRAVDALIAGDPPPRGCAATP